MKNKASVLLKRVISALTSIAKAKSMAIKSKTSAVKARLIMFSLMKNKKVLLDSISQKVHSLLGQHDEESGDQNKAIILYNAKAYEWQCGSSTEIHTQLMVDRSKNEDDDDDDDDDAKYPDLRHSLFEEDDYSMDDDVQGGSVIDMVRNSKKEGGEDFSLENEIDHVADLFINRFHKQMRMQKLESFRRYQEMLQRSL
ncbi:hypothetical protein FNV43_RR25614 [Rhamnella rubrinervis]|uniref:Uncharacterized protein n=1 Tax=Rhamnella rubrinervis TaxID=2594499 RepID=A0A8K0GLQ2_9ROSA|nr:hypothetical protein FNV43_RR25614 [Rhamnella rubrinervis]